MSSIEQEMKQLRAELQTLRAENERLREVCKITLTMLDSMQMTMEVRKAWNRCAFEGSVTQTMQSLHSALAERGSK